MDSIASHFRHDFTDMGLRNRILSGLAQSLIKIAIQSSIAVSSTIFTKFGRLWCLTISSILTTMHIYTVITIYREINSSSCDMIMGSSGRVFSLDVGGRA